MTTAVGRNTTIHVATAFAAAKTVSAVTKADPGVATSTAHGLTNGTVGFWTVTDGMEELHEQASRVYNSATNTFDIQGIDTSQYTTWTAGTFTPASTWALLTESAGLNVGGGAATALDDTRLHDRKTRNVNGLLASQSLEISIKHGTVHGTAMAFVVKQARNMGKVLFRITLQDGSVWVAYGDPSIPGSSLQQGQLATGSFGVNVPQWVAMGAA